MAHDDVAAWNALQESRRFAAAQARPRAALALIAASLALVLVAATALLHLGALALAPVLLLGLAQAGLVRWLRLTPDETRLPPATHVGLAAAIAAALLVAGVLRGRTDLLPAAATAAIGALVVLQGIRARDRATLVLGGSGLVVGATAIALPPGGLLPLVGLGLVLAVALALVGLTRLRPEVARAST